MRVAVQRPRRPAPARDGAIARVVRPSAWFGLHVLEMCVVMCVSLGLLGLLASAATALLGLSAVQEEAPALAALVAAAVLAGSMVVWMRFMGMEWRPTLEMAAPAPAAGLLLVTGYWVGIVAEGAVVSGVCGVACLGMVAVMLVRFRLYSSHMHHRSGAG